MKIVVTNIKTYTSKIQLFNKNQYICLHPYERLVICDVDEKLNNVLIDHYLDLRRHGFDVCICNDDTYPCGKCSCHFCREEVKV